MSPRKLVEELYSAYRAKDHEAFLRVCSPDLEWVQNEGFPRGATWRGARNVVEGVFRAFDQTWEGWAFEIEQVIEAGQTIVVIGRYTGRHRDTGRRFRSAAAHVYDVADGRVARFRQFADTKPIWDAMN